MPKTPKSEVLLYKNSQNNIDINQFIEPAKIQQEKINTFNNIDDESLTYNIYDELNNQNNLKAIDQNNSDQIPDCLKDINISNHDIDQIIKIHQNLSRYLIKEIDIEKLNTNFLIQYIKQLLVLENLDFKNRKNTNVNIDAFSDTQKKLLKALGPEYFPKTLNPEMYAFIDQQIKLYYAQIFDIKNINNNLNFIPVFIPEYYSECFQSLIMKKNNTIDTKNQDNILYILGQLPNIKIRYIVSQSIIQDTKTHTSDLCDQIRYIVTCINRIKKSDEPEVYVFIPDDFLDQEMKINRSLKEKPIKFLFYNSINECNEFLFGCYNIFVNDYTSSSEINSYITSNKTQEFIVTTRDKSSVIEELEDLKTKIYQKIREKTVLSNSQTNIKQNRYASQTQRKQVRKRKLTQLQKLQLQIEKEIQIKKYKTEYEKSFSELGFLFEIIHKKISDKYHKETQDKKYNIDKLIDSNIFHKSSNIYYTKGKEYQINQALIRNIQNSIDRDIKKLSLNINKNITSVNDAIFLIPNTFFVEKKDSVKNINIKRQISKDMPIEQCHYEYLGITRALEEDISHDPNDKIITAFTSEISVNNELKNNKILILLPKAFSYHGKPLYDPNKFLPKVFFYNSVEKQYVNYPLYVFHTNHYCGLQFQNKIKHMLEYTRNTPDIDDSELSDYLINAYKIFHQNARQYILEIQKPII